MRQYNVEISAIGTISRRDLSRVEPEKLFAPECGFRQDDERNGVRRQLKAIQRNDNVNYGRLSLSSESSQQDRGARQTRKDRFDLPKAED